MVIVLAGPSGGEGKFAFLKGLWAVVGKSFVFPGPEKGNFPLLGLEKAKAVFMDEWRFNQAVLSYSTQCLIYDGSPVPIARPENVQEQVGHLLYTGTAPIFATTKVQDVDALRRAAEYIDPVTGLPANGDASMVLRRLKIYKYTGRMPKPRAS